MKDFVININGNLYTQDTAMISVFDRGFLYGDSVYEATRTFNRKVFRLEHHLERLYSSAQMISMIPTFSKAQLINEIEKTVSASPFANVALRIVLTRGTNQGLGLDPDLSEANNLIIFAREIKPNPEWWLTKGFSVIFTTKTSSQRGSLPKSGNYQENMLALKAAKAAGATDALMVNSSGFVTESSTSNAWIIKENIIITPPLSDGVLEGLTRKTLFEMARQKLLPIPLIERSLTKSDFLNADECFITSTTRNLVPVTEIEHQKIANGTPGVVTLNLLERYLDFVQNNY